MTSPQRIAIVGGGNIGLAIARGLVLSGHHAPSDIFITRRTPGALAELGEDGFEVSTDNAAALGFADVVLLCVQPNQALPVLAALRPHFTPEHLVVSVVTGVDCDALARAGAGEPLRVVRAMPNTAVALGESMTCLASNHAGAADLEAARRLFDRVGRTMVIAEDSMTQATALCACGIAFFLRAIRAASQGGIEIGFHAEEALAMAAQTARGAASLIGDTGRHPEGEIDRVTTPMGCTIAGLNRMEHEGFSSALIQGIVTSAKKAGRLAE